MFFNGYFSEGVVSIITTSAQIYSKEYIEKVIKDEIVSENYDLFYESVSVDGVVVTSFDTYKANLMLSNAMGSLRNIADDFNQNGNFEVNIPVSYLFIPSSYILSDITLNVQTSNILYYDVKLKTDIKEYGINSSLITLSLFIEISYQVVVPLMYKDVNNYIDVPLAIEVINGKVPSGLFSY